jgi:hypothetical protein
MRQFLLKCSRAVFGWPPTPATFLQKQTLILRKREEHDLKVFVETGTFLGEMIDAQREHFQKLISIELSGELFQAARAKYAGNPRIRLYEGDSGTKLRDAVQGLDEPALFWLDAHYSRGATAGGGEAAPIIRELSCLVSRSQYRDVILIDDARLFGLKSDYPKLEALRQFASRHWPRHTFGIESDVICILPPR